MRKELMKSRRDKSNRQSLTNQSDDVCRYENDDHHWNVVELLRRLIHCYFVLPNRTNPKEEENDRDRNQEEADQSQSPIGILKYIFVELHTYPLISLKLYIYSFMIWRQTNGYSIQSIHDLATSDSRQKYKVEHNKIKYYDFCKF